MKAGYYNYITSIHPAASNELQACATLVIGSDLDRVNNENDKLKVHRRVAASNSTKNVSSNDANKPASTIIIKSGEIGIDGFNMLRSNSAGEYAYAGIYVGGLGNSGGTFLGDRTLVVEGGKIANIIGGLKLETYLSTKTWIYVKNGDIINIVGGAGRTQTCGERIIQVTGGIVEYSVAGGSNGFKSDSSNTGDLIGNTLVYIGGNATIGKESITDTLYGVDPGTVCGAGNGNSSVSDSGKVYSAHIIIDGNATINGNVYGGGNYGFIQKENTTSSDIKVLKEQVDFESIISGHKYMIFANNQYSIKMSNQSTSSEINIPQTITEEYLWTIEKVNDTNFYVKYDDKYLRAPENTGAGNLWNQYKFDLSSTIDERCLYTYNANHTISNVYNRNTRYWQISNNRLIVNTSSSYSFQFYEIIDVLPDIPPKEFEVDCIDILGGTVKNNVYGGSNQNKIVGNVDINMSGGKVEGTIYGGSNKKGIIEGNVDISIDGGNIGTILEQDAIFGGGYGKEAKVRRNVNIAIQDKESNINILGNIYGGGCLGDIGGTTNINIEDHYLENNTNSITGKVFGGGRGQAGTPPTSTGSITVNVDGGKYENLDIYGGYNINGEIGTKYVNSKIAVNIGENYETTVNDVYGGGYSADVSDKTSSIVVSMKNAIVNNAYNGGNNAGIAGIQERAIYAKGAVINNLFGGSNNSGDLSLTNVFVSDNSKIGNVFGGGNKAKITSNTNVEVKNSEITDNLYGGGNQASVGGYTNVDIQESNIRKVYGGGNAGEVLGEDVYKNSTNLNIEDNSNIDIVYGGGCSAAITKNSKVEINNSTIRNVFGGGEGTDAIVKGTTSLDIKGVPDATRPDAKMLVLENVYGGGDLGKVGEGTNVTITETEVGQSIFGGGNRANIDKNTSIVLSKVTSQNVYGGGMEGEVATTTAVTILDNSIISNNVFGGGSKGNTLGNTTINLNNSTVQNDLFGGGEFATVNGSMVSMDKSNVKNVYGGGDNGVANASTTVSIASSNIEKSVYGGGNGAPAIVKGRTYVAIKGSTTVGENVFGSGNNAATGTEDSNPNKNLLTKSAEKAKSVVDISAGTIGANVYGGANTSVVYGDTVVNIGTEAIRSYYLSLKNPMNVNMTKGKLDIGGTIYGGGEQMDPTKEYNYNTVSVEGYIKINIDGTGYDTGDKTIRVKGSIFGSGHASRAGLSTEYLKDIGEDEELSEGYVTINGDVNIKSYGSVEKPKSMISIQRCENVVLDNSALWISGATDSTNTHATTYFSFNHIDELKLKNSSTLYLRATSNLLKSFSSVKDVNGKEEKAKVEIVNEITGADGKTYEAIGNYVYGGLGKNTKEYVLKNGQIFKSDAFGNSTDFVTDIVNSRTKSVDTNGVDNRVYMYSGLNLNIALDQNIDDGTRWGEVKGMTFFGIYNTTNTEIDQDSDIDISQTTDKNEDFSTIHTGIYNVNYEVSDTNIVNWKDRNFNRSYVEGKHVTAPEEQDIKVDGFYTNYEKFSIDYEDDEQIDESNYAEHNPTTYTDYITPTPADTNYYIWYAGPDQDFYYYDLALIASKLSTYGTIEKNLQGINAANATFKITDIDSSLINGATLYEKSKIPTINTTGNPNKEFALAMKTGVSGWSMNGETNFMTSPTLEYTGTQTYKTENSNTTPSLGFYLYHSNNIGEEEELGLFTINMILYYWNTSTQQARARVTIDVLITTKVYDDLGYDASITPGRQYELFPRTTTNVTTKSSFSVYFQLHEKDFANNKVLTNFFSHKEGVTEDNTDGIDVLDQELIDEFIKTNYRVIRTEYVFPEDTTITMIDKSLDEPTYYYYTVTAEDANARKKEFRLSEFRKMGSAAGAGATAKPEYYLDSNRELYEKNGVENGVEVTYQSECFIFIVDLESAKFNNIDDAYEITANQPFNLILTSDVKNKDGEVLGISILEEYKESNAISYGIYDTDSTIKIGATISPSKIYVGDSADINIETNYITEIKDAENATRVYDTRYFDSKLGVKITIFNEAGEVVHGANLLGAYFKITEADGSVSMYYPRTDGTTRMKIADKVSNAKALITFETAKSTLPTGAYEFLIESFGSADGVYFGTEASDEVRLTLSIVNDEFGLESEIPENYVIIDKETGYTLEDTTGFTIEKEYEILDDEGNIIGKTTDELNEGKNDFEYSVKYTSEYENPYISVALYRRNYDTVYDRSYSLVDLLDYLNVDLNPVPDNIKEQFEMTKIDESGRETKSYVGYEAYGIDFIKDAVKDAINSSTDKSTRPIINLITKCSLKDKLVSGTYKLVFTLYDKSEVEKIIEIEDENGVITAEPQMVTEYQRIGESFSYIIIK